MLRAPLRNSFRKLTKKFFVDTRRQKRSVAGLREHFDNAVAAKKFESRTKWGFLEVPLNRFGFLVLFSLMSIASMSGLTVKLGSPFPEGTAWDATLKRIAAEWRTISDGKVRMNVYPGGVAGNEDDMIRKMRIGQLDAAVFTIFGMKKIVPNSFVMALPGILESEDELDFAIKEFAPRFDEDFINQGFHVLAWSKTGWANFFTASPARTPQLMRKEKLSISNTDSELAANFKALKFNVVPMAINEVIVALQSGMATATYGPPLAAAAYQWFSQVPFMLDYKLAPVMGGIVISERTWRRIPQEYRKGLKAAIETAADDFHIESERLNKEAMHVMKEHGLKIINLSEQEIQDWIKVFTDGHALLIGQWIDEEVYRDFINGLKKMRN